jgi:short-subunit dehydrogenase
LGSFFVSFVCFVVFTMARLLVLVTGASQGIGAAIAKVFAGELRGRVQLALVARNAGNLAKVARACARSGAKVDVFPCDVTQEEAVTALAGRVQEQLGVLDVLINNAGKFIPASFLTTSVADFDAAISANLRSLFLVARGFAPAMVQRGRGDVFNMSSVAGLQPYPGGAAYCAAKFGVTGLSKVMRAELRETGVRVCTVYPGATVSPSWAGSGVAEERMMPAEDVARAFFDVYRLSRRTVVEEIVLRPQRGDV